MKLAELTLDMADGLTKRIALSLVSRLWDPFGYLLPVTIKYRIDLQRIWQGRCGWGQTLPIDLIEEWSQNMKEMQTLKEINTDKCLKPKRVTGPPRLYAFSDGGEDAFRSCVFIRWPTVCGIEIRFIAAKAFVQLRPTRIQNFFRNLTYNVTMMSLLKIMGKFCTPRNQTNYISFFMTAFRKCSF